MKVNATSLVVLVFILMACSGNGNEQASDAVASDSTETKSCCMPGGGRASILAGTPAKNSTSTVHDMVLIPAGEYMRGGEGKLTLPREFPEHPVSVNAFYMDAHEVTNAQWRDFAEETGYKTIAELPVDWEEVKKLLPPNTARPPEENLRAGSLVFTPRPGITDLSQHLQWWAWVVGANWQHPLGPESDIEGMDDHPVVHIANKDARAYAEWAGKRLPTEAEWEWAARGGLEDSRYPWGNEDVNTGDPRCNFFQGTFPNENLLLDGYETTAPVGSFEPNGYGLYDMAGNVWEICSDWFDDQHYNSYSTTSVTENPQGPSRGNYRAEPWGQHTTIRGGSFLCNDSYCASYRVSARMPLEVDAALNHVGFRCVKDVDDKN